MLRGTLLTAFVGALALASAGGCSDDVTPHDGGADAPGGDLARDGARDAGDDSDATGPADGGGDSSTLPAPQGCAIVTPFGRSGMAPLTVHVNALDAACDLRQGSPLTARYAWDFGDATSGARHNTLVGWGGAHTYDEPGSYTITLRITNELGGVAVVTATVDVAADTRQRIYVAGDGDDDKDGATEQDAVKTLARAQQLLQSDRTLLLRRGDTFAVTSGNGLALGGGLHNVVIGAYGSGDRPVLLGPTSYPNSSGLIAVTNATDVVVEQIVFTSPAEPQPGAEAFRLIHGVVATGSGPRNVTVRDCHFDNVGSAVSTVTHPAGQSPGGFLLAYNTAEVVGTYLFWGEGTDHTLIGNTVAGSVGEHNVRYYASRVYIYDNQLTEDSKTTISAAGGEYTYIAGNQLVGGRVRLGYKEPDSTYSWVVMEGNRISGWEINSAINHFFESSHVYLRNNTIEGHKPGLSLDAAATDVWVVNNTMHNTGLYNGFLKLRHGHPAAPGFIVANNLYVQPTMSGGEYGYPYNVRVSDVAADLGGFSFTRNVWQPPQPSSWCNAAYFVENAAGVCESWIDHAAWLAHPEVQDDITAELTLGPDLAPPPASAAAAHGRPVAGVFVDIDGEPRPASGPWSAGAHQL